MNKVADSLESAVLQELITRQLGTNGVTRNLNPEIDGNGLLAAFILSREFEQLYHKAIQEFSRSDSSLTKTKNKFSGGLFHELAYLFLVASQDDSHAVLTYADTLKFYMHLFSGAPLIHNKFGQDSLGGISVPDGIILRLNDGTAEVEALCEYTQDRNPKILINKYNGMIKDIEKFKVFHEAHILFLAPRSVELPVEIELCPSVKTCEIPIDSYEFGRFVRHVISAARRRERKHANPGYSQPLKTA